MEVAGHTRDVPQELESGVDLRGVGVDKYFVLLSAKIEGGNCFAALQTLEFEGKGVVGAEELDVLI